MRRVDPETVGLRERSAATVTPEAWDEFVSASGGSFLGCWRVVRAHRLRARVRLFDFVARPPHGPPVKVGQCAVAIGRGRARFLDRVGDTDGIRGWVAALQGGMSRSQAAEGFLASDEFFALAAR